MYIVMIVIKKYKIYYKCQTMVIFLSVYGMKILCFRFQLLNVFKIALTKMLSFIST